MSYKISRMIYCDGKKEGCSELIYLHYDGPSNIKSEEVFFKKELKECGWEQMDEGDFCPNCKSKVF